ncbi:unnamed protein product [Trichobilharzia regenti]|nr:unnamed protein product [Trichobilharzia regenti]
MGLLRFLLLFSVCSLWLCVAEDADGDLGAKKQKARKDGIEDSIAKYDGVWSVEVPHASAIDEDYALVLKSKAKHHAVSTKLSKPLKFDTEELVIQYDVKFQDGMDCGGAYIKLLSASPSLDLVSWINLYSKSIVLRADNSFERYIDQVKVQSGTLLDDFE